MTFVRTLQRQYYDKRQQPEGKLDFISRIFVSKKKKQKSRRMRSPRSLSCSSQRRRSPQMRSNILSHHHQEEKILMVPQEQLLYTAESDNVMSAYRHQPQCDVLFIEGSPGKRILNHDKMFKEMMKNHPSYFEVVKVEDRGTDPREESLTQPKETLNRATEAIELEECFLPFCKKEKELLNKEIQSREDTIKSTLLEGKQLLHDIEKIKRHLGHYGKVPEIIPDQENVTELTPSEFLHLSRTCLMELGKLLIASHKQMNSEMQKLKKELAAVKIEKTEKETNVRNLEQKLEAQVTKENHEEHDYIQLQLKVAKLKESIEAGKKLLRETENTLKGKLEKLETELASQKQSNDQLNEALQDRSQLITCLQDNLDKLKKSMEETKQELKDVHCSQKTKIAKLELEHSNKMALLCENQTVTNKELSQALHQSSKIANQLQDAKKENASLLAEKHNILEKMAIKERELEKISERCSVAERKLSREGREVASLQAQLERMETVKEEELMSIDGATWLQIMYQQDQSILNDLKISLQEKEKNLEALKAQGDCALKDFDRAQDELQQRRHQFNELKYVFLDFEKKRDIVVQEQKDFYNKMSLLNKKIIHRDRFYKNLIEECQIKSCKIEDLEKRLKNINKVIEEEKKASEAQLKAMQSEMKFTANKLYEFENEIRKKESQLKDVIKVCEQENKNKTILEEALQTYKILLEDSKKENTDLRNRLNYLEDIEKNMTSTLKATEELSKETQRRRDTESKLKNLERELNDMKNLLESSAKCPLSSMTASDKISNCREIEELKTKVKVLEEDKKYLERILKESHRSKELLQKDQVDLYKKLRHAVRLVLESKGDKESLELNLDKRLHTIHQLEERQADTEDKLDVLKDVLQEMKKTIELLDQDREKLQHRLENHVQCQAERAVNHKLKLLQKDKALLEEQFSREKEMLLQRLRENEDTINEQHKHLRAFQEQLTVVNAQLQEARDQLITERHNCTQQLLTVEGEKKKLERHIQELLGKYAFDNQWKTETSGTMTTTPKYFNSSDSYGLPNHVEFKKPRHRK